MGNENDNWKLVSGDPTGELERQKRKKLKKKSGEWDVERVERKGR